MMIQSAVTVLLTLAGGRRDATSPCSAVRAIEVARAATAEYCHAAPQRTCAFTARAPVAGAGEDDPELRWVIKASQIHSYDQQHRPRFMPEGARFVHVSNRCEVMGTRGHER
jgi:hypothetical protein